MTFDDDLACPYCQAPQQRWGQHLLPRDETRKRPEKQTVVCFSYWSFHMHRTSSDSCFSMHRAFVCIYSHLLARCAFPVCFSVSLPGISHLESIEGPVTWPPKLGLGASLAEVTSLAMKTECDMRICGDDFGRVCCRQPYGPGPELTQTNAALRICCSSEPDRPKKII